VGEKEAQGHRFVPIASMYPLKGGEGLVAPNNVDA